MQSEQQPLLTFRDLKQEFECERNSNDIQSLQQIEYDLSKHTINQKRQHRLDMIFEHRISIYISARQYINGWVQANDGFIHALMYLIMISTLNFIYYAHILFVFIEVTLNSIIVLANLRLLLTLNSSEIKIPTSIQLIKLEKHSSDEDINAAFNAKTHIAQQFRSDDWYAMGWLYLEIIKDTLQSLLISVLYQNFYIAFLYLTVDTRLKPGKTNIFESSFFENSYIGYDLISKEDITHNHYFSNIFHHEIKAYDFLTTQLSSR